MANHAGNQKLLEMLTCPICLDKFQSPKTLPCSHSFCAECLDLCRGAHRNSLDCPMCKRNVKLPFYGVRDLPVDHRILQIFDIYNYCQQQQTLESSETADVRKCHLCRAQKRRPIPDSTKRCGQCSMEFCPECAAKHDANPVFATHKLHDLNDSMDVCPSHVGYSIKYYCRQCQILLCTICVLEHNSDHKQEPWDRSMVEKNKEQLREMCQEVSLKMRELKGRTKRLETLRQKQQGSLYALQMNIKSKADELVQKIRAGENQLLEESQVRFDGFLRELGLDALGDLNFRLTQMEAFHSDVEFLLNDSFTCNCLFAYDVLSARYRGLVLEPHGKSKVHDSGNSSTRLKASKKAIKFIPRPTVETDFLVGSLQEFTVVGSNEDDSVEQRQTVTEPCSSLAAGDGTAPSSSSNDRLSVNNSDVSYKPHRKRTKLILDAMKCDGSLSFARLEMMRKEKKIKSPSGTSSRNHLAGTDRSDVPVCTLQVDGSAPAFVTNSTEVLTDSSDNTLLTDENEVIENSGMGLVQNWDSNIATPTPSVEIQPQDDVIALQISESHIPSVPEQSAGPSGVSSLGPGNGEGRGTSSEGTSAKSPGPDGTLSKHVRPCLQIEKIGGFLGNLLPSKSIVFIINSVDNHPYAGSFSGGLLNELFKPTCPAPDWLLVVAETGHRLHVFDSRGSSNRLIGWGNIEPQVVVCSEDGVIYCTDKKDMTVKAFHPSRAWFSTSWKSGMFEHPHGLALTTRGHLVVTDVGRRTVTVHCGLTGRLLQRLAHPETFSRPAYVAVDKDDNVYVSDIYKRCIFVFDSSGCCTRTITLPLKKPGGLYPLPSSPSTSAPFLTLPDMPFSQVTPQGLAIDPRGNLAVCDLENSRVISCSPDGSSFDVYAQCVDLLRPVNISFDRTGKYFAVVESLDFSGTEHGRVKVFEVAEVPAAGAKNPPE